MTDNEIDNTPAGKELDALIESEIFGAIPLTDEEWDFFRAASLMLNASYVGEQTIRALKFPLAEPDYHTKLMFRLQWPSDYSSDAFGSSRRVVDKMREDGWLFEMCDYFSTEDKIIRIAGFMKGAVIGESPADADALAICRAALTAVRKWRNRDRTS